MSNNIQFVVLGDVKDLENKLASLKKGFDTLTKESAVGFAVLTAASTGFIESAREQELAINQLNQALKNQGHFSEETSVDLQKYADQLQSVSLFDNTVITKAEAVIAALGYQGQTLKDITKATADLAQAQGIDMVSAAELVTRALGGQGNMIRGTTVALEGLGGSTERARSLITGISRAYGGQAEAATQGLGATIQLKNSMDDLSKSIGRALSPTVVDITTKLKSFFDFAANNPALAKTIADFLKLGIEVTAAGVAIGLLSKAAVGATTTLALLNSQLQIMVAFGATESVVGLAKAIGFLPPVLAATAAGFAGWKFGEWISNITGLTASMKQLGEMSVSNQIGQIQANTEASLAAHNQTMQQIKEDSAARLEALKIKQTADDAYNKSKIEKTNELDEFIKNNQQQMDAISATQNQQDLIKLIQNLNDERQAKVNSLNMELQFRKNNGLLTAQTETDIRDKIASVDARYDQLELLGRQQLHAKMSNLEQKGLDISRQVNAGKVDSLESTLQQAAGLNSAFATAYQVVAIGNAIMNTAAGVTRAFMDYPFPVSLAVGGLIAAAGAVQIATIASQSFAVGSGNIPQDMIANVHKNEIIVPATFSDAIRKGDLSLSGSGQGSNGSGNNSGGIVFDFTGAEFNGINDTLIKEIFTRASEGLFKKTLAFRGVA